MMNIALCTDENFSIPALVCITSIFENNREEDCHIYVLTDWLSSKALEKFKKLEGIYSQKIDVLIIDKHRFDGLTVSERFPVSMYYRFLLPEMLPLEERVLYLDCDIIVRHSLSEMYFTNLHGKALAAVVGESCDDVFWNNYLKLQSPFFSSGVLLINLKFWREHNAITRLVKWTNENPTLCLLPDQDALNKVFEGYVIYLNYTYNYQEWWFGDMTHCMHYTKWDEIREIGKDPVIVHFCEAVKPWFKECTNPFHKEFLRYAALHDFIGFRLLTRYGLEYKCSVLIDKIGLKFRYWAEKWQKHIIRNIKIS